MIFLDLINLQKIRKAIVYLAVIIVTMGLQTLVFSRISVFGVKAMFVPVIIVAIGMFEGGIWGGVLGLVTGMLLDNALAGASVTYTLLLPLVGFFSGLFAQFYINKKLFACILLCLGALLLSAAFEALPLWAFWGSSLPPLAITMGLQTLYSLPFSVPAFYLCRSIAQR